MLHGRPPSTLDASGLHRQSLRLGTPETHARRERPKSTGVVPGFSDAHRAEVLEQENTRLRRTLRTSRMQLGTPVSVRSVAGAGYRHPTAAAGPQRRARTSVGMASAARTDVNHHLGRAWRSAEISQSADMMHLFADGDKNLAASIAEPAPMNPRITKKCLTGAKGEWQLKFEQLEKVVKMVIRPTLKMAQMQLRLLRPKHAQLEEDYAALEAENARLRAQNEEIAREAEDLRAQFPNGSFTTFTQTELRWPGPALEQAQRDLEHYKSLCFELDPQVTQLRQELSEATEARTEAVEALARLQAEATRRGAHAEKQLQLSRHAAGRGKADAGKLRDLLDEEQRKQREAEERAGEAGERLEPLQAEMEELRKQKKKAYQTMGASVRLYTLATNQPPQPVQKTAMRIEMELWISSCLVA